MTSSYVTPPPIPSDVAPTPQQTLHRLFLTLFVRGRSSRGLQKKQFAPTSIVQKLALIVGVYFLMGIISVAFVEQSVFALSVYLHATTFAFLGMFLASSAGEVLFNKEESDILLHRPIDPRTLLWSKIRVLVEASLWIAAAFNFVGFIVGCYAPNGGWLYIPVHAVSLTMEALFCAGCVVMVYQLCLQWFGRERLDGLITSAQVLVSVGAVLSGQILPRLVFPLHNSGSIDSHSWWVALLPPAWFAGLDDAIAGDIALRSWILAFIALAVTALVLWLAFEKLARSYDASLQILSESVSRRPGRQAGRRWVNRLAEAPPLRWWLRDPVVRASFVLTTAYLLRDRDVKLRVYPAVAPLLILPIVMFTQPGGNEERGLQIMVAAFLGGFVAVIPASALTLLRYSQQWQATDVFRAAPISGPARLGDGARRAVICALAVPLVCALSIMIWLIQRDVTQLALIVPGVIGMPVFAMAVGLDRGGVPFTRPTEESQGTARGLLMFLITMAAFPLGGMGAWAWYTGWFRWFLAGEIVVMSVAYWAMYAHIRRITWHGFE